MPDSLSGRLSPVPYLFGDYTLFLFRGLAKGGIRRLVWLDLRSRVSGVDGLFSLFGVYSLTGSDPLRVVGDESDVDDACVR